MRLPRRAPLLALLLGLVLGLVPAFTVAGVTSAAAAKTKRCPQGTIAVGTAKAPTACAAAQPRPEISALQQAVSAAAKQKLGARPGKRSARAAKLTREALAFAQARVAAGQPIFETRPAAKASRSSIARIAARSSTGPGHARRAAEGSGNATVTNAPASFGNQVTTTVDSSGNVTAEFTAGGVTMQLASEGDQFSVDIRDRSGAGGFAKFDPGDGKTPRCPTAAGDVPSKFDSRMTIGQATAAHGKREVIAVTLIVDGPWQGYVGVGAKAERFDVALRGALELRYTVEIAATRKVIHREPTRTYRSVFDRKAVPIGTSGSSLIAGAKLFGPKGGISSSFDRTFASALADASAKHLDLVSSLLRDGDERWYERRMCARTSRESSTPDEVVKGDTARWQVRVTNEPGETAADAQWTVTSTCGAVQAQATRGPTLIASVVDSAGKWSPDPYAPACVKAEVTSTAGRAADFTHTIEPKKPDGLRFTVKLTYNETMGSGIAEMNVTGTGSVFLPWNADDAEGTGTYEGSEWDGTVGNPCGEDMSRSRGFSGKAIVGVHRNRDGTFSVVITAVDRPLRLSFLAIVPAEGGTRDSTGKQPFCGEAGRAKTTTKMAVTTAAVPADG